MIDAHPLYKEELVHVGGLIGVRVDGAITDECSGLEADDVEGSLVAELMFDTAGFF